MSTVEDVRQVIQDFLAPDIREIRAKLDAIDQRFDALTQILNYRFESFDLKLQAQDFKIDARFTVIESKIQQLVDSLDLDRRLKKLEAQQTQPAA